MIHSHRHNLSPHDRILAVNPCSRGLGFAVATVEGELFDSGLVGARADRADGPLLSAFRLLESRHHPVLVLMDDTDSESCARSARIKRILSEIRGSAFAAVEAVPRAELLHTFACSAETPTKQRIAEAMATLYPELAPRLPPPRKPWASEDPRLAYFWAVALIVHRIKAPPRFAFIHSPHSYAQAPTDTRN